MRRRRPLLWIALSLALGVALFAATSYESYGSLYDAEYVGSARCGTCHTQVYEEWQDSPHARMASKPSPTTVVGDFANHEWRLPGGGDPVAKMTQDGDGFFMALRHPQSGQFVRFPVDYVIGFQNRQCYLTREPGGVLRRLPLEWSPGLRAFFPYWNFQEGSPVSLPDLWQQMGTLNSAWNLFCARCHTTHLEVLDKDQGHTRAVTRWSEDGIACEACHGPGSQHVSYFAGNYVNRVAAFANSKLRGQPVAFIANGPRLTKGQDLSICARCHGPDIQMATTDIYRDYEPGYSKAGRINDLSPHFKEFPLQPGRKDATVECYQDGKPKGIAMVFRSFLESRCYERAEVRCYDCHAPHNNKMPRVPGILDAGPASDAYCLRCHTAIASRIAEHTHHKPGTKGAWCYDCHMPRHILNLAAGYDRPVRTHTMSDIPTPGATVQFGQQGAPNACTGCHDQQSPQWAVEWMAKWWKR